MKEYVFDKLRVIKFLINQMYIREISSTPLLPEQIKTYVEQIKQISLESNIEQYVVDCVDEYLEILEDGSRLKAVFESLKQNSIKQKKLTPNS